MWSSTELLVGQVASFLGQSEPFCGKFSMLQIHGAISRTVITVLLVDFYC